VSDEFEPRRSHPGATTRYNTPEGVVTLTADDEGVIRPKTASERDVADAFSLPVARKVIQEERAAKSEGSDG
jgi:hypothetical protein